MEDVEQALQAYIDCINRIDDYFEYRFESVKDRAVVMLALEKLTDELVEIYK